MRTRFEKRLQSLEASHKELVRRPNKRLESGNGIYNRYMHPVLTAGHIPVFWRYDLNYETNPYLMERFGIHAVLTAGAIILKGKYLLIAKVEGTDGKPVIAVAESSNGTDNFEFWEYPLVIPSLSEPDLNIYDMRLVQHEDSWIYGIFFAGRPGPGNQQADPASCIFARTRDFRNWERLPDLKTQSGKPWNLVLHPGFVEGKYAFYILPGESFTGENTMATGLGFSDSLSDPIIEDESKVDGQHYQLIKELKAGIGPAPVKTQYGWLHLVYGKRITTAGLQPVLYVMMTDLKDPLRVIYKPAGYLLTPEGDERTGDAFNVVFTSGWVAGEDGTVYLYYACSDNRLHVATTTIDQLLDYVMNTAPEGKSSNTLLRIIDNNKAQMQLKPLLKEKDLK